MSTISVSNIQTANGSEPLTLATGNTAAGKLVVGATGGIVIASNSTANSINIFVGTPSNTLVTNSSGAYFTGNVDFNSATVSGAGISTGKAIAMAIVFG